MTLLSCPWEYHYHWENCHALAFWEWEKINCCSLSVVKLQFGCIWPSAASVALRVTEHQKSPFKLIQQRERWTPMFTECLAHATQGADKTRIMLPLGDTQWCHTQEMAGETWHLAVVGPASTGSGGLLWK